MSTSRKLRAEFRLLSKPALDNLGRLIGRVGRRIVTDDVPGRAAQLSYYFVLSLFPLLVFLFALLGLVFRAEFELQSAAMGYLRGIMPPAVFEVVSATMIDLKKGGSGEKMSLGLVLALWLASSGMVAVIEGLNVAYRVSEWRPWWRRRALALAMTIGMAVAVLGSLGLILLGGRVGARLSEVLPLISMFHASSGIARWTAASVLLLLATALIYRFAPNVPDRHRRSLLPGAIVAVAGWFVVSSLFGWYLDSFSNLGATYGALAAVIALLIWLDLTGAVLLIGGILNSEIHPAIEDASRSRHTEGGA